jgi:signal transduction histidine kinase
MLLVSKLRPAEPLRQEETDAASSSVGSSQGSAKSDARYYGGLGLGLWIARTIVEAHAGTLTVASELGKGSVFTVTLPLAPSRT